MASAVLSFLTSTAFGQGSLETAAARYSEDRLDANIFSVTGDYTANFLPENDGRATSLRVGATHKQISFKNPTDLLDKQLDGDGQIDETAVTATLDQGLAVGTNAGLIGGSVASPLARTRFYGLRLGQWWRQETLQTVFELRRTTSSQDSLEFTDTDGKRIRTPEDVVGTNASLTVTHMTMPSTILRGSYSSTMRNDRPPAWSTGAEVRQYIDQTQSALHFAVTHYENLGTIEPVTQYGTIIADSARAEWQQKILSRWIGSLGYRYYLEKENPRPADAAGRQVGTDSVYGALRWRYGDGAWTEDMPEIYMFFNKFNSNDGNQGLLTGLGARLLF